MSGAARGRSAKRATPEQRLKLLQAQVDAAKAKAQIKANIAKAKSDLKALQLSGRRK